MKTMLAYVVCMLMCIALCSGTPQSAQQSSNIGQANNSPMGPNDYWNWRNPLYGDYWQREAARRQWAQRNGAASGYYPGATAGPDSQYTYKTYDNPEFYGYDSVFPGGRAHFIGYKTQGGKKLPRDWNSDQNMRAQSLYNAPVTKPTYPLNPVQNFQ